MNPCKCGCGILVEKNYKRGHWLRGMRFPEEWCKRIAASKTGSKNHRFGVHLTDVQKQRLSEFNKGKKLSEEHKRKLSEARQGKGCTRLGYKHSEETRIKISKSLSGGKHFLFGKFHSEETKEKISKALMGNKNWLNISSEGRVRQALAVRGNTFRRGKTLSDISKKRISDSLTGKRHSDETKRKMSISHKKISQDPVWLLKRREARSRQKPPVRDTKPELIAQQLLNGLGIYYLKHKVVLSIDRYHQFDIVLPEKKVVIEVDGCYWHGCEECGFGDVTNNRDSDINEKTVRAGWKMVRIWEHEIKSARVNKILEVV